MQLSPILHNIWMLNTFVWNKYFNEYSQFHLINYLITEYFYLIIQLGISKLFFFLKKIQAHLRLVIDIYLNVHKMYMELKIPPGFL